MVTLRPHFRLPSRVSPVVPVAAEFQSLFDTLIVTFTGNLTPGVAAGSQFAAIVFTGGQFREVIFPPLVDVFAGGLTVPVSLGGVVAGPARLDYTPGPMPLADANGLLLAAWADLPVSTS